MFPLFDKTAIKINIGHNVKSVQW